MGYITQENSGYYLAYTATERKVRHWGRNNNISVDPNIDPTFDDVQYILKCLASKGIMPSELTQLTVGYVGEKAANCPFSEPWEKSFREKAVVLLRETQ